MLKSFPTLQTTAFTSSYLAVYLMYYFFTWYLLLFQHNEVLFPPGTIKILPSYSDIFFYTPLNSLRCGNLYMSSSKLNKQTNKKPCPKYLAVLARIGKTKGEN